MLTQSPTALSIQGCIVMEILILGGTQFIGYHTVKEFVRRGCNVTVVNRGYSQCKLPNNVKHIQADRNNTMKFEQALRKTRPSAVLDFSCFTPKHLIPSLNVFRGMEIPYVFCSTVYVYQHYSTLLESIEERNSLSLPIDIHRPRRAKKYYGFNKRLCEDLLLEEKGIYPRIIRIPPVVGRHNNEFKRELVYIRRILHNELMPIPHKGERLFHMVHVEDVARVCYLLATRETKNQVYNLASQRPLPLSHYVKILGYATNSNITILPLEESQMKEYSISYNDFPFCYPFDIYYDTHEVWDEFGISDTPFDHNLVMDIACDIADLPQSSIRLTPYEANVYQTLLNKLI